MTIEFDLDACDTVTNANAGVDMPILQPGSGLQLLDPEKKPQSLRLVGQDSEIYRSVARAALVEKATQNRAAGISDATVEQIDRKAIDVLVACTVGWNVWGKDGKKVSFSTENVRSLYERFPSIRDQADMFIVQRANFLLVSPKS